MDITTTSEHISVMGHRGTWYVIHDGYFRQDGATGSKHLFLLEHETYGDEAACVIVDKTGKLILDDVWNGFGDLLDDGWEEAPQAEAEPVETMAQFLGRKLLPRR